MLGFAEEEEMEERWSRERRGLDPAYPISSQIFSQCIPGRVNGRDLPEDPLVMRRLRSPGPRTVTGGATVCCQSLESSEPIKRLGFLTAKQLTDNQSWV